MTTPRKEAAPPSRTEARRDNSGRSSTRGEIAAFDPRGWLAAIVQSSDDAIIGKDLDGVITSWNRAAERLYGYSAEEMVGQSVLRIIPPGLEQEEEEILAKIALGQSVEHYETLRVAKDGTRI